VGSERPSSVTLTVAPSVLGGAVHRAIVLDAAEYWKPFGRKEFGVAGGVPGEADPAGMHGGGEFRRQQGGGPRARCDDHSSEAPAVSARPHDESSRISPHRGVFQRLRATLRSGSACGRHRAVGAQVSENRRAAECFARSGT
jgi:hypothetical protein